MGHCVSQSVTSQVAAGCHRTCQTKRTHCVSVKSNHIKDIHDEFDLKEILGKGGFAQVQKGVSKRTCVQRAIKCIYKDNPNFEQSALDIELDVMQHLDHPNVIRLFQSIDTPKTAYLVLELCEGGDLFHRVVTCGQFPECDAALVAVQLLRALAHLHKVGVIHRDLKPENCLFLKKGPIQGNVLKLLDFGLADRFKLGDVQCFTEPLGTAHYVAPEVISRGTKYGPSCDLWSAGAVLYTILSRSQPFAGDSQAILASLQAGAKWSFHSRKWKTVSEPAKRFVGRLMEIDVAKRYSAAEALRDSWLRTRASSRATSHSNDVFGEKFWEGLQRMGSLDAFQKASLRLATRHLDESVELHQAFAQMDPDGKGGVTAAALCKSLHMAGLTMSVEDVVSATGIEANGEMDYTGFLVAAQLASKEMPPDAACREAFVALDADGNQRITSDELAAVLPPGCDSQKIMLKFDKDGDGSIDYGEFTSMFCEI